MKKSDKKKSNSNLPDDPLPVLLRLNTAIEQYIKDAVATSFEGAHWDSLSDLFEPIRCWQIKHCGKRKCPSYCNEKSRCWLTAGTFCGGEISGEFAQKYDTCFECEIFKDMADVPVRRLSENINTLIAFIKDEALKLRQLAIRDPLTHLYNRHFFNEVVEREAARSKRNSEPLSFIMLDLDHFKKINDTLGHLVGDGILRDVAALIRGTIRRSDLAFRFGGDEFLVLMLNADCTQSARMAKRLLAAAGRWNREHAETLGSRISFSMGCSTLVEGDDIHTVLRKADSLMYLNKKSRKEQLAPKRPVSERAQHDGNDSSEYDFSSPPRRRRAD